MSFSETPITYPDGQTSVVQPPNSMLQNGFVPKQIGVRGQSIPAQYLNWLFRELFRGVERDRRSDGAGFGLMDASAEGVVTLHAMDTTDVNKYVHAVGWKAANAAPVFKVLSSATLTIGTVTTTDVPVTGATSANIAVRVSVR